MKTKVVITSLALVAMFGLATAQNKNQVKEIPVKTTQNGPAFVDKNNNGICDNFENGIPRNPSANGKQTLRNGSGRSFGNGIRSGRGHGRYFIDKNTNGVCDNFENGTPVGGRGAGSRNGLRNGRGSQVNFVDANNNGICDRREITE